MFLNDDEEKCVAEVAERAEEAASMKTNLFNVYNYRPEDKQYLVRRCADELSLGNARVVFAYNKSFKGGIPPKIKKTLIGSLTWYTPTLNLKYSSDSIFIDTQFHALFCHLVHIPFYTLVRTENQIAYSVSVNPTDSGFCVQIGYDGDDKATLQIKLAHYMMKMHTHLDDMPEEIFAKHRASLAYKFQINGEEEKSSQVKTISREDICTYAKSSQVHFDQSEEE